MPVRILPRKLIEITLTTKYIVNNTTDHAVITRALICLQWGWEIPQTLVTGTTYLSQLPETTDPWRDTSPWREGGNGRLGLQASNSGWGRAIPPFCAVCRLRTEAVVPEVPGLPRDSGGEIAQWCVLMCVPQYGDSAALMHAMWMRASCPWIQCWVKDNHTRIDVAFTVYVCSSVVIAAIHVSGMCVCWLKCRAPA